jgi:hypothetical protein
MHDPTPASGQPYGFHRFRAPGPVCVAQGGHTHAEAPLGAGANTRQHLTTKAKHTKKTKHQQPVDQLQIEYERAKKLGWLPYFREAATKYDFPVEILMAIGSRETELNPYYLKHPGDYRDGTYHGYGLMQMDIGSYPDWIKEGHWKNARDCILKGAEVLASKRKGIQNGQGKKHKVGKQEFTGAKIAGADLLRVAIAAYNSGDWAYYNYSTGHDPDRFTTGKNYSKDVLRRAVRFGQLLAHDAQPVTPPPSPAPNYFWPFSMIEV